MNTSKQKLEEESEQRVQDCIASLARNVDESWLTKTRTASVPQLEQARIHTIRQLNKMRSMVLEDPELVERQVSVIGMYMDALCYIEREISKETNK